MNCSIKKQFTNNNEAISDFTYRENFIQDVLELTINDLPFGNTISNAYKEALRKTIEYLMFYQDETKIAVLPLVTGAGKTTTLQNVCTYMFNNEYLRQDAGTIILRLQQKDCDETATLINQKAGREIAYSFHSADKKNRIKQSELECFPIVVTTHEGYKRFVDGSNIKLNRLLQWSDKQINRTATNWNKYYRRRLVIDEEISNVKIFDINIESIAYLRNHSIQNFGNTQLYDIFNDFCCKLEKQFLRPSDVQVKANKLYFKDAQGIEVPEEIEKAICEYGDYRAKQIFIGVMNFIKHGGYLSYNEDRSMDIISTFQYIDINHPLLYTIVLDATAETNYLYKLNDDYEVIKISPFKTYKNTLIHVYKLITGVNVKYLFTLFDK